MNLMARKKKRGICSYCGTPGVGVTTEHVFPSCLYGPSKAGSKVQRLTIPGCEDCNNGWSEDEAHFRNMLTIAGEPNAAVRELWEGSMRRSFDKVDGPKRLADLFAQMIPVQTPSGERHMVYPAQDPRVVRVLRKIVRGLCHYHAVMTSVPEEVITVDVLKYVVPQEFLDYLRAFHREADIVQYRYQVIDMEGVHSVWLLGFFERRKFIAWVKK